MVIETNHHYRRLTFAAFLSSDSADDEVDSINGDLRDVNDRRSNSRSRSNNDNYYRKSNGATPRARGDTSPCVLSPWNQTYSPYNDITPSSSPSLSPSNQTYTPNYKSPWIYATTNNSDLNDVSGNGLIRTIVRQEEHVYSLAASGDLLFTGSDSKNIRVWKDLKDFARFRSNSGLVKAIVISGDDQIFTGHQDGKIRVWKGSRRNPSRYSRLGSLPTFKDFLTKSLNTKNYVEVRRNKNVLKIRHYDAVSCLSLNEELGLLYSGSWDKTLKIWRLSDSKCLESIEAHDDAINTVAAGFDDLIFTGSADGTLKVWKRELEGKLTKHFLVQVLMKQKIVVTALAVNLTAAVIYCGASDGSVNFWEREKFLSHGGTLRGHRMAVLCLATGGSLVFSGGADRNICVWRRNSDETHFCLSVLIDHEGPVKCLAVAAMEEEDDGNEKKEESGGPRGEKGNQRWILYSGSLDKSLKVWRMTEHAQSQKGHYGSHAVVEKI